MVMPTQPTRKKSTDTAPTTEPGRFQAYASAQPLVRLQDAANQLGKSTSALTVSDLTNLGWNPIEATKYGAKNEASVTERMQPSSTASPTPIVKSTSVATPAPSSTSSIPAWAQLGTSIMSGLVGVTAGPMVGAATQAATQQMATAATQATPPAPTAALPQVPAQQPFQYQPSGYSLNASQAEALARQRAELAAGYRRDALRQALERRLLGLNQAQQEIPGMLGEWQKTNDEEAARSGFYNSGRRFALRDKSNQRATQELANLLGQKNAAITEATDAEMAIARDQGLLAAQIADQLLREDRDFALRERAQQYSEYSGDRQYGLSAADIASQLASRDFALQRGQAMLPYELEGMNLSNLGNLYQLNDTYNPSGLTYQQRAAQLLGQNITNQQNMPGGQAYMARELANRAGELNNTKAAIANKIAELELTIAQDPNIGARAQAQLALAKAQKDLQYVDAQIASTNALAQQRTTSGNETQKDTTNADNVKSYLSLYRISRPAAQAFVDYLELVSYDNPETGRPYTDQEAAMLYDVIVGATKGLMQDDKDWLYAMRFGGNTAETDKILKRLLRTETPYERNDDSNSGPSWGALK